MKLFSKITLVLFLAATVFSCEKEVLTPENVSPELFCNNGIIHPTSQCGVSEFTTLIDGNGTVLGNVEIANDGQDLYIMFTMNQGRFVDELKCFIGDPNMVDNDGANVYYESFQIQSVFTTPKSQFTIIYPIAGLGACTDIILWSRVSQRNMFGSVVNRREAWMNGLPFFNLKEYKFCMGTCSNLTNPGEVNF